MKLLLLFRRLLSWQIGVSAWLSIQTASDLYVNAERAISDKYTFMFIHKRLSSGYMESSLVCRYDFNRVAQFYGEAQFRRRLN